MGLDFGLPAEETAIWFGILVLIIVGIGLTAPPIRAQRVRGQRAGRRVPLMTIYRGVLPFIATDLARLALVVPVPGAGALAGAPAVVRRPTMPTVTTSDGCILFTKWTGTRSSRPAHANSLGTTLEMWDPQIAALSERYHVLRFGKPRPRPVRRAGRAYDIERLGRDALALIDAELEQVRFCVLSKGGMVGLWLGANAGDRLERLKVIANSSAHVGNPEVWGQRIATVRERGMAAIVPGVIDRWFTPQFQNESPEAVERIARMLRGCPPDGYVACCAAVRDMDQRRTSSASVSRLSYPRRHPRPRDADGPRG